MAGTRVPMREVVATAHPRQMFEFGDKIHEKLVRLNKAKQAGRERSGAISGGKLGKPTLWAVLDMIGVPDELDPYLLGKFQRGNDVEARAINFLTNIPVQDIMDILDGNVENPGWIVVPAGSILGGEVYLQRPVGYRGGVGFVDLSQRITPDQPIIDHEVKSVTKMAYDKVAASGRSATKKVGDQRVTGKPEPYYHHEIQLAYYCLGDGIHRSFLHYFNADDYRLTTFALNPLDYKEEIDKEIDDIQAVFLTKQLPSFEGFLPFHKLKNYWSYTEWNELTPQQMIEKLERQYPEAYTKLMETKI